MTLSACAAAVANELGLNESDVREIIDRIDAYRKRQLATGQVDRIEEKVRQFAKDEAANVKLAAALKQKQAALNIIVGQELRNDIATLKAQGVDPATAVMGRLVGLYNGIKNARKSVSARRIALEAEWNRGMLAEFRRELPHVAAMLQRPRENKPFFDDVVREWRQAGSTGNKDARKAAEILEKYAEASRLEANRAGANIGRLDGWGGPQSHDETKLMRAGRDAWIADILPGLDIARSFGEAVDRDKAVEILADVYRNIVTGVGDRVTAKERGEVAGPASLARSLEKHRVLHFKDADSWIAYSDKYGRGNVFQGMLDHLHSTARTVSLMQVLGPNPRRMLDAILEEERKAIANDPKLSDAQKVKQLAKLNGNLDAGEGKVGKAFVEVMGDTFRPVNLTAARWSAGIRATESLAKLGGAVLSSVTDLVTYAHAMRFQGKGLFESYHTAIHDLFNGRSAGERRQIALQLGVGAEAMLHSIHSRYDAADNLPGMMSNAMGTFFKWSGLTWWTDRLTESFATMSAANMAEQAGKAWDALDPVYRQTLEAHGIGAERWQHMAALVSKEGDYRFIWPEAVKSLEGLSDRERREFELDLRAFFSDEATFGVVNGDDRTRMFTTQGTRGGTAKGEAIRFLMQFKSFPVAYTQKVLAPAFQQRGGRRDWGGIAHLVAMSTLLGYIAMTAKDALKNRTPKDPTDYQTILAAFAQGGGLGIYGDFLFGSYDRFGGNVYGKIAGPALGTIADAAPLFTVGRDAAVGTAKALLTGNTADLYAAAREGKKAAGDAFYLALNNAPFLNLWYTRAALDLAVLNQIQEWISPGTLQRRQANIQKQFGQKYIINPVQTPGVRQPYLSPAPALGR